jgi:hypothetical protein
MGNAEPAGKGEMVLLLTLGAWFVSLLARSFAMAGPRLRVAWMFVWAITVCASGLHARADDETAPAEPAAATPQPPPQEPAADGTTSVVVPADPPAPPAVPQAPLTPDAIQPVTPPLPAQPPVAPPQPPVASQPPPSQPAPQSESSALLARMLEPIAAQPGRALTPADAALYARPMQLLEPLIRSGDRARRLWIVQAYWKVAANFAAVRCGTEALERLELVAPGADPHDRATLDVATAAASADLADARARLNTAQQELVDLARLPVSEPVPWPVDRPLADPYQTHFEAIFANRIATGRVRAIVRSLPARHEALAARATAVLAAEKAMTMAEADHAKGKRPIEAVIAAHAALVGQQEDFLEAVRTYNLEIAEYAMAVAELSLPDDQFVAMLIGTPIQWRPPNEPPGETALPPTAGLPAVATSPPSAAPPATAVE